MNYDLNTDNTSIYYQYCEEHFIIMKKCVFAKKDELPLNHLTKLNANDALNYVRMASGSNISRVAQDCIILISEYALNHNVDRIIEGINEHLVSNPELQGVIKSRLIGLTDCPRRATEVAPILKKLIL